MPIHLCRRREKVFGPGRAVPLDRNAKVGVLAYARAWGARHKQPGQHAARSPAPSWKSWRRCYGASTTVRTAAASRATNRLRPRPNAAGIPSMRR
jgi:hypothetical protein